jgi:hypothetical protein
MIFLYYNNMKRQVYSNINKNINDINNKLRNETSLNKINILIKKREELVSEYMSNNNIACSDISLPLQPQFGGTGLSMAGVFPITFGGTGYNFIPENGILIGNNKSNLIIKALNGNIIDTESDQKITNKMFDNCTFSNIDLNNSIQGVLPLLKGGTGVSSIDAQTLIGNTDCILTGLTAFSAINNGNNQIITQNPSLILNWKTYDNSDSFDINTGIYTVPFDGYYIFTWSVAYNFNGYDSSNNFLKTTFNSPDKNYEKICNIPNNIDNLLMTISGDISIKLKATDKVYLSASINSSISMTSIEPDMTWFTGILVSRAYIM